MSESDSFIKEVTEEVRQDRMFRLWKRYAPFVIGAIILIVGAAAVWNWMEHRREIEARERGGAFIESEIGSVEAQRALVDEMEGEAEAIAQLRLAAALAASGSDAEAARTYREAAGRGDLDPSYRDFALLNALKLEAPTAEPAALIAELEPLVAEGAPYRPLALEFRAALHINAGDIDAARQDLEAATTDPMATGETRRRVNELLTAIGTGKPEE